MSIGGALRGTKFAADEAWRVRVTATVLVLILLQLPLGALLPGSNFGKLVAQEGLFWLLGSFLIGYVMLVERRPFSSIGWQRPTWKSFVFGLAAAAMLIAGFAAIYLVLFPAFGIQETQLATLTALPLWFQALLIVRAAIFEELYYRGFAIERLTEIAGRRWLAALISLAAFTLAHLRYWGWAHLIVAGFGGIVFTALYLWRRDLATCMIAHFVTDSIGFVIA
jgi:uncharacterized protein